MFFTLLPPQAMDEEEPLWRRPMDQNWGPFERAALRVFDTWDVLERAVDEGWGGDDSEGRADKRELREDPLAV